MSQSCSCSCNCESGHERQLLSWMEEWISTPVGLIPVVKTVLDAEDHRGGRLVRWGFNRMNYRIEPGIYGVGTPDASSPVLVTANYKLTFDALRQELSTIDAWILVLDTKGINVWCAAGKGTFGTEELVQRIQATKLAQLVSHRQLILPQLGAPGIAAHQVKQASGFQVIYGPIRANDLPAFLHNQQQAEPEMRQVTFDFKERAVLVPVELRGMLRPWGLVLLGLLVLHLVAHWSFSGQLVMDWIAFTGAFLLGGALVPLLLPWIPGRSFALKGWLLGLVWAGLMIFIAQTELVGSLAYLCLLPPIVSYLGLNFTGCTPYTSLSGVKKEMRLGIPLMVLSGVIGLVLQFIVIL